MSHGCSFSSIVVALSLVLIWQSPTVAQNAGIRTVTASDQKSDSAADPASLHDDGRPA